MPTKPRVETSADSAPEKMIRLRVWLANEHGYELNQCHIEVPAEDLIDCDIEEVEEFEEAKQELIDDYIGTLFTGVDKPRCEDRKERKQ